MIGMIGGLDVPPQLGVSGHGADGTFESDGAPFPIHGCDFQ